MKIFGIGVSTAGLVPPRVTSRVLWAILVVSLLSACGGGNDALVSGQPNGPNIHADVPSSGASRVTTISTPAGEVQRDQTLLLPNQVGATGYLILATDAEEELFLAAFADPADSGVPMLTVESTADAFALIAQGSLPAGVSRSTFVQAVRRTQGYPRLIATVRAALDRGVPPADDPQFWQSLAQVLSEALTTPTATASLSRSKAMSLARPSTSLPLPAVIVDGLIGDLAITGAAPGVNGVRVSNGLPTHFAGRGETTESVLGIAPLQSLLFEAQIPIDARSIESIDFSQEVDVPGNGDVWNLRLFKSRHAKIQDFVSITEDLLDGLLGASLPRNCVANVAEAIATANWSSAVVAGSAEAVRNAWRDSLLERSTWETARDVLSECSSSLLPLQQARVLARFLARIPLRLPILLVTGTNVITKSVYMAQYWSFDTRIGVCQALNESSQVLEVIPCMATLSVGMPELNLQTGERQTFALAAFDERGYPMSVPANAQLEYSSSREDQVAIDRSGVMTAVAATGDTEAPVQVTAVSRKYGLTATMSIRVVAGPAVAATLTVSRPQVTLGQSVALAWNSVNATTCTGDGAWTGPASLAGSSTFTATSTGTFTFRLQCAGNGQVASAQATVEVLPDNGMEGSETLIAFENGVRTAFVWQIESRTIAGGVDGEACVSRLNTPSPEDGCIVLLSYIGPITSSLQGSQNTGTFTPRFAVYISWEFGELTLGINYYGSDRIPPGYPPSRNYSNAYGLLQCGNAPGVMPCTTLQSFGISIDSVNRRVNFAGTTLQGLYFTDGPGGTGFGETLPITTILNGWVPY